MAVEYILLLHSRFLRSTALVVIGQLFHESGTERKVWESIFKWVVRVHQCFAIDQLQHWSTKVASSAVQIEGTFSKRLESGRTPQRLSKQAIAWIELVK